MISELDVPKVSPKIPHTSDNQSKLRKKNVTRKNNGHRPNQKIERKKKLPMTTNLGHSLVKNVKGCKL